MALGMFVLPTCVQRQMEKKRIEAERLGKERSKRGEVHRIWEVIGCKLRVKTKD